MNTLPGTAAEILHDDVRAELCPDKLKTSEWLAVMEAAHRVGFRTTATIMFGHIDTAIKVRIENPNCSSFFEKPVLVHVNSVDDKCIKLFVIVSVNRVITPRS